MDKNNEPVETIERPATEHGWLRRPEMDGEHSDAWEKPDGTWVLAPRGVIPKIITRLPPRHLA